MRILRKHKNVIIQTVTYRPVWPAVSAPDFYCNVYFQCVFTDVTKIKMTYYYQPGAADQFNREQLLLVKFGESKKLDLQVLSEKIKMLLSSHHSLDSGYGVILK